MLHVLRAVTSPRRLVLSSSLAAVLTLMVVASAGAQLFDEDPGDGGYTDPIAPINLVDREDCNPDNEEQFSVAPAPRGPRCVASKVFRSRGRLRAECTTTSLPWGTVYPALLDRSRGQMVAGDRFCGGNSPEYLAQARAIAHFGGLAAFLKQGLDREVQWEVRVEKPESLTDDT